MDPGFIKTQIIQLNLAKEVKNGWQKPSWVHDDIQQQTDHVDLQPSAPQHPH
jgi:hypothetical protein